MIYLLIACSLSYEEQVQLIYLECLKDPPRIQVNHLTVAQPEMCNKILQPIKTKE